jgi:AraC-like DNA-binding protein
VAVLLPAETDLIDIAGPACVFSSAARCLLKAGASAAPPYALDYLSPTGGLIDTRQGLTLPTGTLNKATPADYDTVIVTGGAAAAVDDRQSCRRSFGRGAGGPRPYELAEFLSQLRGGHRPERGAWVETMRVENAKRLLSQAESAPQQIAFESGFGGYERMRRTVVRRLGISPITYRKRFGRREQLDNRVDFAVAPNFRLGARAILTRRCLLPFGAGPCADLSRRQLWHRHRQHPGHLYGRRRPLRRFQERLRNRAHRRRPHHDRRHRVRGFERVLRHVHWP